MDFTEEIVNLISLRQEGGFWDFKREWYSEKHRSSLLHDIICMANNLANRDAYIIIGVDEENDYSIRDVTNDPNRKNTQMMVTFLRDKKFAGDVRPTVYVESMEMECGTIDVIVIKNSSNTPFYLKNRYEQVLDNHIYTRIQDSNTPKDTSADIHHVEYLWKKRFGLTLPPLERMLVYLQHPENWEPAYDEGADPYKYYRFAPEYIIQEYFDTHDGRNAYELFFLNQINTTPSWSVIKLCYQQTVLDAMAAVGLDGGRYYTPAPDSGYLPIGTRTKHSIEYLYFIKESPRYIVHKFYCHPSNYQELHCHNQFMKCVLIFESEYERQEFHKYVNKHWGSKEKYTMYLEQPIFSPIFGYDMEKFEKQYLDTQILNEMLTEFRMAGMKDVRIQENIASLPEIIFSSEEHIHPK